MRCHVRPMVCTVAFLIAAAPLGLAQSEPETNWLEVRTITVGNGCMREWREAQKNAVNPMLQAAGVPWREAWRTHFGTVGQYVFVVPISNFAQFDQPGAQISAYGGDVLARCNRDLRIQAVVLERELSNVRPPDAPLSVAVMDTVSVVPGKIADWQALAREVRAAMRRSNVVGLHVGRSVFGGPREFVRVAFLDSMAALDSAHPFVQGLGREAAEDVFARQQATETIRETVILRFDPELSFSSAGGATR